MFLLPDCVLPGCHHPVAGEEPCPDCRDTWGPHLVRTGDRPAWIPSGWVLHADGWAPPWGIRYHPDQRRQDRAELLARLQVERDLRRIGLDTSPTRP